jgi:hypothetical protein
VRARKRKHLQRLLGDRVEIAETPKADYRWRTRVSRDELSLILEQCCNNLDYDNFKKSVSERDLREMYTQWWGDHHAMQVKDIARAVSASAARRIA